MPKSFFSFAQIGRVCIIFHIIFYSFYTICRQKSQWRKLNNRFACASCTIQPIKALKNDTFRHYILSFQPFIALNLGKNAQINSLYLTKLCLFHKKHLKLRNFSVIIYTQKATNQFIVATFYLAKHRRRLSCSKKPKQKPNKRHPQYINCSL